MKSAWSAKAAAECVAHYGEQGVSEELALRVYTTRLLGREPDLVLHGGGNTSLKTTARNLVGDEVEVIHVKGTGRDMGRIEPDGMPAVRLGPLRRLRALDRLADTDMVNYLRANLMDSAAPNPSVETLLHAFLPHRYIDHTHASAVLSLIDQPDGEALAREVYGERLGFVPYAMSGLALARAAADTFEENPKVEGLLLDKHGIFTFGDSARQAYRRMIEMVTLAEQRIAKGRKRVFKAARVPSGLAAAADIAPIIRGLCVVRPDDPDAEPVRLVATFRTGPDILTYVNGTGLADYSQRGVVTPDHIIRTRNRPLVLPAPHKGRLEEFAAAARQAVADYAAAYDAWFRREQARRRDALVKLDAVPRVVLVQGLGLFGLGRSHRDAAIAADLAENTVRVVTGAEAIGRYQPAAETDLFDVEYWSLEQAKLGAAAEGPLARQVAVVTGGAGAIGKATARALQADGADVAILDIDAGAVEQAAAELGALGLQCDVTDRASIRAAYDRICETFGGVDILVSNAGAAWQGRIGEVDDALLRKSFELNFFAHQAMAQGAVRVMLAQGTGGCLLFNVSKQAVNPGPDFGPYGLPKAATMFLVRQYAVDYGADGIRSSGVNADRIRSGLLTDSFIAERSKARGISEHDYMAGNLLRREVLAEDVAQAFAALARARKTTGHIETVDGGNIAAALR